VHSRLTALDARATRRSGGQPQGAPSSGALPGSLGLPLLPVLVLLALACGDPTRPRIPYEEPLAIIPATQTLPVPRTLQASANGGAGPTSWESSDHVVADVSASGVVTAMFPGEATITVRRGSQSATLTVSVTATRLDVAPSPASVAVEGTVPLMAIARDADGTAISGVQVSWSTANGNIASVDMNGLVTGIATGITMISAAGGGAVGSTRVTVGTVENPFARIAFSSIRTVGNYACGLEAQTGLAYCWGDNHAGALGIGEVDGWSDTPVLVNGARRFRSLSVGFYGNCAVEAETGLAYCWGSNRFGDLGDGTFTTRWFPTLVQSGGLRFSSISASGELSCGVEAETGLGYCWGREGRIGDGTSVGRRVPTLVGSGGASLRFTSISVGGHACGVEAETGHGYCWGPNESGQLGDGTTTERLVPTLVAGGRLRFSSISPGDAATCGVEAETGSAYCWGSNALGQLGDGTTTPRPEPEMAGSALRLATVSSRGDMVCGIEAETGVAYCWGRAYTGAARLVPTMVANDRIRFSSISVGGGACAVEAQTGRGYCWGDSLVATPLAPPATLVSSAMR